MKLQKFSLIILAVILLAGAKIASAQPFLICDPQTGVETYTLYIDGTSVGTFNAESNGSAKIDLAQFNLPDGLHTYRLIASNVWGDSGLSDPLENVKVVLSTPMGKRLSK